MRTTGDELGGAFEEHRPRLTAMASRMLGSGADAEDAVQEAWLRLSRQQASIDNIGGWLTTVVSRVCIDILRARATKTESSLDEQLDWVVTEDDGPEHNAVLADSVGAALQVVLDTLTPDERLAFVLHDTFGVPFVQIADIIDKSTDAAKQLASRARRKVRGAERPTDLPRQRQVVDAFLAAAREGDFDALLHVLDPNLTWRLHTPRGAIVHSGSDALARQAARGKESPIVVRRVNVDGRPGVVAWRQDGAPLAVMRCTVAGDRIVEVESITDRALLATMDLPPFSE
ncbi:sigma-70 family RNA polymerase sigma factor [Humibacter ginsenosidimutans]|uniref:Sigma-70 family RNA polymerase sigma factor n=1 Tax=Humibacter ginsenosidimutans TaxID=2599293 RepID=A0A5B8M675_9MICO|nr:sigma-70 family RNA polymerase sigma factor [Humibacter ginsenosidimutans]QDZ15853.1 sigma-70 family RNA polymerase sigma factor [Humibacter ginsenosidimutans]